MHLVCTLLIYLVCQKKAHKFPPNFPQKFPQNFPPQNQKKITDELLQGRRENNSPGGQLCNFIVRFVEN